MLVRNAKDAISYRLVDKLCYDDEMRASLLEDLETDELNLISYRDYSKSFTSISKGSSRIAVVVASGDIVGGEGGWDMIGDEKFVKTLRELRENDDIKAVVLRVNSPGGSYLASDAIWREVKLLTEKKPVIASMSDYAASGGYYISMAADTIVAHPNTITGSIGIFSIIFNVKELMNKHLGITTDGVKTGVYSDLFTMDRPLDETEKSIIQTEVNNNYDTFIRKAAEGRDMTEEEVRSVASGRVWTGSQALEKGLVDVLGDFNTAVELAAEKAGIADDYRLRYYPPQQTFMDVLLGNESVKNHVLQDELGVFYPYVKELKRLERMQGVQARSPYLIEIH
jgi:protease-4